MQSAPTDDGGFVVEYRDGGPDSHFATDAPDMSVAHGLVMGRAWETPNWSAGRVWTQMHF